MSLLSFIAEKKANFAKFLRENTPAAVITVVEPNIKQLEQSPTEMFVAWWTVNILPQTDIDKVIASFLSVFNLHPNQFSEEAREKFKRYVALFNDVISK